MEPSFTEGVIIHERPFKPTAYGHRLAPPTTGLVVWPEALALAKFFTWHASNLAQTETTTNDAPFKGKRVLELGAGPGIVGLLLGKLGSQAVLTDSDTSAVDLEEANIVANELSSAVSACRLDWLDQTTYLEDLFDIVVASGVLYLSEDLALAFLRTLAAHLVPGGVFFVGHKHRSDACLGFFTSATAMGFKIERLEDGDGFVLGDTGGKAADIYQGGRFVQLDIEGHGIKGGKFKDRNDRKLQILRLVRDLRTAEIADPSIG